MPDTPAEALKITAAILKKWSACAAGFRWFQAKFPEGGSYPDVMEALRQESRHGDMSWLARQAFDAWLTADFVREETASGGLLISKLLSSDDSASGYASRLAASGYASRLAASGNGSSLAASGYGSSLAASGYGSSLAASGDASRLAATGYASRLAASGDASDLAATGHACSLAASGYDSSLAATGDASRLAASGKSSRLAATGHACSLAASGDDSVIAVAGLGATVTLGPNGCASIAYHDGDRVRFATVYVGEGGVESGIAYCVRDGKIVQADAV